MQSIIVLYLHLLLSLSQSQVTAVEGLIFSHKVVVLTCWFSVCTSTSGAMCIFYTTPYFSDFWLADLLSSSAASWGMISSLFKNETLLLG